MAYIALARKWRSKQFKDIVGQTSVVKTLMNSIEKDRVHHAYLFTGSRGIGKTSIARIFSKALRCEFSKVEAGWLTTCDECSNCREIQSGQSVDVLEMDGASNNGVDAIRDIRENARFLPSYGKRKIYIIDEVHMLTTAAFNALLKTLEEPPEHVLFILATTEYQKIPNTILSRCQRFDLKRMTPEQIEDRLSFIAEEEKIQAEKSALSILARAAEGSMRDSLSLFDQVIAYSGGNVTTHSVRESIGLVSGEVIYNIIQSIFEKKPKEAIQPLSEAYKSGIEMKSICKSLLDAFHAVLLLKLGTEPHDLRNELPLSELQQYQNILPLRDIEEIELFFQVFHHGYETLGRSPTPRLWLEILILKCASAELLTPLTPTPGPNRSSPPHPSSESINSKTVLGNLTKSMPQAHLQSPSPPPVEKKSLLFGSKSPLTAVKPIVEVVREEKIYTGVRNFENFIQYVKAKRPLLGSVLEHASCEKFPEKEGDEFVICFSEKEAAYYREQTQTRLYQDELMILTKEFFGIKFQIQTELRATVLSLADKKEKQRIAWEESVRQKALNHPVLLEARSLFGGDFGPIELIYPSTTTHNSKENR